MSKPGTETRLAAEQSQVSLRPAGQSQALVPTGALSETEPGPVRVEHVADFYHRYPGEVVTYYTRLSVDETLSDLTLRISLPQGLHLEAYQALDGVNGPIPYVEVDDEETHYLVWSLEGDLLPGSRYEYQTQARLAPTFYNRDFESRAVLTNRDRVILDEETVTIKVWAKGKYLRYLPEIYEQDELMGRFLMLFESFWGPIDRQISSIHHYFDPRLTPASFLPWLASWLDLKLDETWPEERLRQLIRWAIALHRSRGTKWGLLKYLELYTGQKAEIVEHRAANFVLGPEARLGLGLALGRGNIPHTFTVSLRLPPVEARDEAEQQRKEELRRQTIKRIIEMQKPAHTVYTLHLEIVSPEELSPAGAEIWAEEGETEDEIAAQAAIWFHLDDARPGNDE